MTEGRRLNVTFERDQTITAIGVLLRYSEAMTRYDVESASVARRAAMCLMHVADNSGWSYEHLVSGTYHLTFIAHIGAWMDLRKVGPATRVAYPTYAAAQKAAEKVKRRVPACESYEIEFKPKETTDA